MQPAPMPRMRPTVLPACVPRVRSARSVELCGAGQSLRPARRGSLARTTSRSTAVAATSATSATRSVTAVATLRTLPLLLALSGLVGRFCTDSRECRSLTASLFPPPASRSSTARLSLRLRRQRFHRQTQASALIAIEQFHAHAITLLDDIFRLLGATVLELGN